MYAAIDSLIETITNARYMCDSSPSGSEISGGFRNTLKAFNEMITTRQSIWACKLNTINLNY